MPITYKDTSIFNEKVEAIINTVNCVGVMGKGIALEFKQRWPENFKAYAKLCKAKQLVPGSVFVFEHHDLLSNKNSPRFLINFPTKNHWRTKSKIEYIRDGLDDLFDKILHYNIKSIAIPPLGCGNGGLDWHDVRPIIESKARKMPNVEFIICAPDRYAEQPEYTGNEPSMTPARANLIATLGQCSSYFDYCLTRLILQKITYFLQESGVNFGLNFAKKQHGPYSEELHQAFKAMEDQGFITGYKDNNNQGEISITPRAFVEAQDYLDGNNTHTEKIGLLIQGFESPFGMELLSSVHFLAKDMPNPNGDALYHEMQNWNAHKKALFTQEHVNNAYTRLSNDSYI